MAQEIRWVVREIFRCPQPEQRREMLVSVDDVYFGESKPKEAQTPVQV